MQREPTKILADARAKTPPTPKEIIIPHDGPYGTFPISIEELVMIICREPGASELVRNYRRGGDNQYHHIVYFGGYCFTATSDDRITELDMIGILHKS